MKKTILFTSIILLFFYSCSDDDKSNINDEVIGKWKLIEAFGLDGIGYGWTTVEDGYFYHFMPDQTFESDRFVECTTGNFYASGNQITLDYSCDGFGTGIESPAGVFVEKISFQGDYMILTPIYLDCDEGCDYKFEKMED